MVKALRPDNIRFNCPKIKSILFWISISAFTLWLGNYYEIFSTNLVINTFAGPLNLIGALDRPGGFYDPIYINNYDTTNIFTAFRGLVSDFSISGSLMISFVLGYFYQNEFQRPKTYSMDGVITLTNFLFFYFLLSFN